MKLTDRVVRFAVGKERPYYLADGDGLYLKVARTGTRTWMVRSQREAADRWVAVGRYPAMTLATARLKAAGMRARPGEICTVAAAFEEYRGVLKASYRDPEQIERRFDVDIIPYIGEKRLDHVTRMTVAGVIKRIVDRGSRVAANRTLPDIKNFLTWCVEKGWIEHNPTLVMTRKAAGGKETSRERALENSEIAWLISRLQQGNISLRVRLAAGLLMLTGQRTGEVLGIGKHEVKGCWWTIPAERTKPGRAHKVYLSPQAKALLRIAFREIGIKPFVYMDRQAVNKAISRLKPSPPFTPHDLRRTMATRLSDMGVEPYIVEKMLNHRMGGVWAIYNRAEYLPERREAWRLWGRHLAKIRRQR